MGREAGGVCVCDGGGGGAREGRLNTYRGNRTLLLQFQNFSRNISKSMTIPQMKMF